MRRRAQGKSMRLLLKAMARPGTLGDRGVWKGAGEFGRGGGRECKDGREEMLVVLTV